MPSRHRNDSPDDRRRKKHYSSDSESDTKAERRERRAKEKRRAERNARSRHDPDTESDSDRGQKRSKASGTSAPRKKRNNQPTHVNRSCTNPIGLIVFVLMLLFWGTLSFITLRNTDLDAMLRLRDMSGKVCGIGENKNRPLLYAFKPEKCIRAINNGKIIPTIDCDGQSASVCVPECPLEPQNRGALNLTAKEVEKYLMASQPGKAIICTPEAELDLKHFKYNATLLNEFIRNADQPNALNRSCTMSIATKSYFGRLCLPAPTRAANDSDSGAFKITETLGYTFKAISDLRDSYIVILGCFGVALLGAFVWLLLMRIFAAPIVWISLLSAICIFLAGAVYTGKRAYEMHQVKGNNFEFEFSNDVQYYETNLLTWVVLFAICAIIFLVLFMVLLALRRRVSIAIGLLERASSSIAHMPTMIVLPFFSFIFQTACILLVCTLITSSYMVGGAEPQQIKQSCLQDFNSMDGLYSNATSKFCEVVVDIMSHSLAFSIFNFACGLWTLLFCKAFFFMAVAMPVTYGFWRPNETHFVTTGVLRVITCHLGSLAWGSLIITFVTLLRMLVGFLIKKEKHTTNNAFIKGCLYCCSACLWTFKKLISYLNKNIYIMICLYGDNLCTAGSKAFELVSSNLLRAFVLDKVTDFVILLCRLIPVAAASALGWFVVNGEIAFIKEHIGTLSLWSPFVPVVAIAIGSFLITSTFFNVYSHTVDTLFICALEDLRINNGEDRPYAMPKKLQKVFDVAARNKNTSFS